MQRKVAGSALKYRIWERSSDSPVDNHVTNVIAFGDICQILSTTLGISHFLLTPTRRCTRVLSSDEETPSGASDTG